MISMRNIKMLTVATALLLLAAACADDSATTTDTTQPEVTLPPTTQAADSTTTVTDAGADENEESVGNATETDEQASQDQPDTPAEDRDDAAEVSDGNTLAEEHPPDNTEDQADGQPAAGDEDTTDQPTGQPEAPADTDTSTSETPEPEEAEDQANGQPAAGDEDTPDQPDGQPEAPADTDTSSGGAPEPEGPIVDEPVALPVQLVIYEGIPSEERCLVAGGDWNGTQCIAGVFENPEHAVQHLTFWHPTLMEDAYNAVDPDMVEADYYEAFDTRGPWGINNYHVFYHYNDLGDTQVQYETMRQARSHAVRSVFTYVTDWVWFPHRYDVSWSDEPNVIAVTGTYPLGEQRTLLLHADPEQRSGSPDIELPLPLPPPIRPTMPFAEAQYPDTARHLGRGCDPVEEVWDGYGAEVTDYCTRTVVENVVNLMWKGDAQERQAAIRDGHAMADFLHQIDNIEDPYLKAILGHDSRVNGWTYIQDVYWAGHWPGASMIHIEWSLAYPQREFTPEEQEAKVRNFQDLKERGYDVPDEYLGDEQILYDIGWSWKKALVVRTADGTWRMSYRAVCYWYQSIALEELLLCPEDPNPHFPDSVFFDNELYPPSHKLYYRDSRDGGGSAIHQDQVSPRRSGLYEGVPPS